MGGEGSRGFPTDEQEADWNGRAAVPAPHAPDLEAIEARASAADAASAARAHSDVPALAAEVRALRARLAQVEADLSDARAESEWCRWAAVTGYVTLSRLREDPGLPGALRQLAAAAMAEIEGAPMRALRPETPGAEGGGS